jgi:hypothetical protein
MSVIQHNLYDYLKIVHLFCYKYDKSIPNELILHVFSYLKDDIIEKFQKQYVCEKILCFLKFKNCVNNEVVRKFNDTFNLHIYQVPYYSLNNISLYDLKNIILNIDSNFYTSHYCCNGKGIVMFFGSQRYCHFIRNM